MQAGTGAIVGALVMYFLDPSRGARRRGLLRNQVDHLRRKGVDFAGAAAKDARNRTVGLIARIRSSRVHEGAIFDDILVERIRSRMGRVVSHPRAIEITSDGGAVTLRGDILKREARDLIHAVESIRGVETVVNHLEIYDTAAGVPRLQPDGGEPGDRQNVFQENWAPATRAAAGIAGGVLLTTGLRRGGALGVGSSVLGIGLIARSITNRDVKRLTGIGGGRDAVSFEKTISIDAPVEEVYGYFSNYEYFPYFMRNVREVMDIGGGRSHWTVAGPIGTVVEWDAELTKCIEGQVLAWKSLPGAAVQHAGLIRFSGNPDGSSRVQIQLSYNPPAGAIGHAAARLLGADPKTEMDEDLARMKTFIETGHAPHDASRPASEPIRMIQVASEDEPPV
ncbi:MAG TPA: SRPBCC family protein [Rhodothermales bacterium]|nr:SRPBCC family protein [Rhodothermales bacterium]